MGDYSTAILGMVVVGVALPSAVVFALLRPSDLPEFDQNNR